MANEIQIRGSCDYSDFYETVRKVEALGIHIEEKVNGFDSLYYDFKYEGVLLTLHYNVYLGITLYPRDVNSSSEHDRSIAKKVSKIII